MTVSPSKRKVFCPACSRLLQVSEGSGVGDEMECPFCLARFEIVVQQVLVGRLTQTSPYAVEDPASPLAGEEG